MSLVRKSIARTFPAMIEILAHSTSDCNSAAISLHVKNGSKYVIGQCGEGLQRSLNQNKNRMGKLQSIFLTGCVNWKNIGGLPGFLLTVTEQGARSLSLQSGGNNLAWACNSWRNFMFHNILDLTIAKPDRIFKDEFVAIAPILLNNPLNYNNNIPKVAEQNLKSSLIPQENTFRDDRSTSYIIQILPSRGKFRPDYAKQMGVKPGFDFGKLSKGESVTTENGAVVTPDMVMDTPKIPPRVLVVDIPNNNYIDSAINADWNKKVSENTKVDIRAVYHFLGENVEINDKYEQWIQSFGNECLHYIIHPKYTPDGIVMKSAEWLNIKLRENMPDNFTKLYKKESDLKLTETENIKLGLTRTVTQLEPIVKHLAAPEEEEEVINESGFRLPIKLDEPQVITLGTGSAMPSKYRNVLSSLVRVPFGENGSCKNVLLDAGEGTLGTIKRVYGTETEKIFQQLELLYISHLHADHHLGAMSILREWIRYNSNSDDDDNTRKLFVIAPKHFQLFINEWFQLEQLGTNRIEFIDTENYIIGQGYRRDGEPDLPDLPQELKDRFFHQTRIAAVKACRAFHCDHSYSISFSFKANNRFKVAFSGDTRPNDFFARRVGTNCDVLIHEATHENELAEEAKKKRHSTIDEALGIANEMRAKVVILTHFSQRYPKLPEFSNDGGNGYDGHIALAFDGMQMYLSQIGKQREQFDNLRKVFDLVGQTDVE